MKGLVVCLVGALALSIPAIVGFASAAAPAPTLAAPAPTKAAEPAKTAEPAKPAEPTKAPAAQPSAAPAAKKINFPEKGRTMTIIVPFAPGGGTDILARLLGPVLEGDLGVVSTVVNKPGAGSQIGLTELAMAKPDGYTLGIMAGTAMQSAYLDPERKAVFNLQSFEPVSMLADDPVVVAVKADSPFKTLSDIIAAAKADPEKLTLGTTGVLSTQHMGGIVLGRAAGAKFAYVHMDSAAQFIASLLGGHTSFALPSLSQMPPRVQSGEVRVLAVLDKRESQALPGVKTTAALGYDAVMSSVQGVGMPAGTPKEIVDIVANSVRKAVDSTAFKQKINELYVPIRYMGPVEYMAFLVEYENQVKQLMALAKQQQ